MRQIHTPDSSRYWLADTYDERHAAGLEPQNIDKEFLRLWFRERCDPYADKVSCVDVLASKLVRKSCCGSCSWCAVVVHM